MLPAPFDRLDLIVGGVDDDNGSRVAVMICLLSVVIWNIASSSCFSREAAVILFNYELKKERETTCY